MSAAKWGRVFETHSGDRWDFEDVAHSGGVDEHIDAYTTRAVAPRRTGRALRAELLFESVIPAGSAVACKVCLRRQPDGQTTRRGRWYVSSDELAACDAVALGVYHEDGGIIGPATTVLSTATVEALLEDLEWVEASHDRYDLVKRPSWSRVFEPEVVNRA